MTDWKPMDSAPRDGTEIVARETEPPFREKVCYFYQLSPKHVETWPSKQGGILLPFRPSEWHEIATC